MGPRWALRIIRSLKDYNGTTMGPGDRNETLMNPGTELDTGDHNRTAIGLGYSNGSRGMQWFVGIAMRQLWLPNGDHNRSRGPQ